MGQLFKSIRQLVAEDKYVVGQHASERLEARGIMEWQVVVGLADGEPIAERPDTTPNPVVEVRQSLLDGPEFKAVWFHLHQSDVAKLVTVHFSIECSYASTWRTNQADPVDSDGQVRRCGRGRNGRSRR